MKTFNRKDIFTIATAEEAKEYLGKDGYFGDSLKELEEAIKLDFSEPLAEILPERVLSQVFRPCGFSSSYILFIPANKVKEIEEPKKYRAFKDFNEFANTLGLVHILGSEITYRTKAEDTKGNAIITRECTSDHMSYISLGSHSLSLENLFKYYEWLDKDSKWQPFGVLDEN